MEELIGLLLIIFLVICLIDLWRFTIFPNIVDKNVKEIEKNPKWLTPKLRSKYYGFSNIDIITVNSSIGTLPRFRLTSRKTKTEEETRLEVLIPDYTSVDDIDAIATLALYSKIVIFHGITPPDKPAYWLATLLYMLDGGDMKQEVLSWEDKIK